MMMTEIEFRDDVDVDLVKTDAADEDVAHAAWVSTKGDKAREIEDPARIPGLINYLMRSRHGSVFEHNHFTFFIRCPIFVIREFHRHRVGWSYNEESGRYSKLKPQFYLPAEDRPLVQVGKPGAYVFVEGTPNQHQNLVNAQYDSVSKAWRYYESLLEQGVAKEVARMHLPLNIYSSFYATCNARSLMHFLSLRTKSEDATYPSTPQQEIQYVADKMEGFFAETMPVTHASWVKNGRVAP